MRLYPNPPETVKQMEQEESHKEEALEQEMSDFIIPDKIADKHERRKIQR